MTWKILEEQQPELAAFGKVTSSCSWSRPRPKGTTCGSSGEFNITGHAHLVDDAELRALAVSLASYEVAERYILFEFDIESAASTVYAEERTVRRLWKRKVI